MKEPATQAPDVTLVDRLAAIPYTGAISDILDELGYHDQVLPHEIQACCGGGTVTGRAMPLLGEATDSTDPEVIFVPFLRMLGDLAHGDVLVSQPNDDCSAHLGELSAETAKFRGARGAVIDGGVRDSAYVDRLGFPVFARYRTPLDIGGRWRLLSYGEPVEIGGVRVAKDDLVVGDADGVLVIPSAIAEEVVTQAEAVVDTENLVRKAILEGVHPLDAFETYGRF